MQFKKIAFFTLFLSVFFVACSSSDSKNEEKNAIFEKEIFRLNTTDAKTLTIRKTETGFTFDEFKEKAVLINFFATWCPPCKAEIPHLNNLREKYKEDFEVVSILMEKNRNNKDIKEFIKEFKVSYPVTNSLENYDFAEAIGGVKSIPTMYLLNKEGKIIQKYVGIVPEEMMEIDIKRAIK